MAKNRRGTSLKERARQRKEKAMNAVVNRYVGLIRASEGDAATDMKIKWSAPEDITKW